MGRPPFSAPERGWRLVARMARDHRQPREWWFRRRTDLGSVQHVFRMRDAFDMIAYPIGTSGQTIILADNVIEYLQRYRQLQREQLEAGGQLFARIEGAEITIVEATGPRPTDRRTRTAYVPDRRTEKAEIAERHVKGLH